MKVQLFDRVLVDSAPRRERRWGRWQFPMIYSWQGKYIYHFADAADAYDSYGHPGWDYMAEASALHWEWCQDQDFVREAKAVKLPNGDMILKKNENSALMKELKLPSPIGDFIINDRHYFCYPNDQLPPEVGGLLMLRKKAGESEWKQECAVMKEKHGIRCGFAPGSKTQTRGESGNLCARHGKSGYHDHVPDFHPRRSVRRIRQSNGRGGFRRFHRQILDPG